MYHIDRYSPSFLRLLYDLYTDNPEPPFRDPESLKLLKLYGIECLEEHWYSIMVPDPYGYGDTGKIRLPLTEVGSDLQYALTLLYYSRKGFYLSYKLVEKKIWQALSEMPFDILVAVTGVEIGNSIGYLPDELLFVNYPYCGTEIEVHCKKWIDRKDSFYSPLQLSKEDGADTSIGFHEPERYLYLGKDGLFYTDIHASPIALAYYWPNDLKKVIHYMTDKLSRSKIRYQTLLRVSNTYSLSEFQRLLESAQEKMCVSLIDVRDHPESYHIPALSENFQIVNHLTWMPMPTSSEARVMVVEKRADGTRIAYEEHVSKGMGGLEKLVFEALEMRKEDASFFCLYLNLPIPLDELEDLKWTVCGIRVQWDRLEIFDRDDAREIFLAELKEITGDTEDRSRNGILS